MILEEDNGYNNIAKVCYLIGREHDVTDDEISLWTEIQFDQADLQNWRTIHVASKVEWFVTLN